MRLWTTMPARVYKETIEKTGIYQCDPDKCEVLNWDGSDRQFANAYDWMSGYMTEKIGPPPEGIKYPVWAWYRLRTRQARPDLRWVEFRGAAKEMVLIELEKEDSQVVLSDEEIWTVAQLNDTAWCRNDEELDWYYNPDMEGKEKFKKESWYRVLEIDQAPHVQATFWELRKEEIKKIWKYNKKAVRLGGFFSAGEKYLLLSICLKSAAHILDPVF